MVVGELVGQRYELEELVGTGGMSNVFKANDTLLERKVALKVLHEQFTRDADYLERFRREARSVAQLSHPNIVTVIDRGEESGRQFIVFEYIDGESLKELVERTGPLPVAEALELTLQVARALAFAHHQGLVHRDVKPQNVLLNDSGQAKVTDFGIARSLEVHGLTQTGTVLGTSNYIAPEQAQGERVDALTDVYSLGVVLYELLVGDVPFHGDNFVAVAMRHINEPPPSVREQRPEVSPRLDAAVRRAMAKDPADRFGSMDDFCAELPACLAELEPGDGEVTMVGPPAARAPRARPPRGGRPIWPLLVLLAGLAVLAAIAVAVFAFHGSSTPGKHRAGEPPSQTPPIHLSGVTAFDPVGGDGEHNAAAPLATDGNSSTYWGTEHYSGGLNKAGVGLVLDAGRPVKPSRLTLTTDTPGLTALVKAGSSDSGPFAIVSPTRTAGGSATFPLNVAKPARYFLVWITSLPAGREDAHVNEVRAR